MKEKSTLLFCWLIINKPQANPHWGDMWLGPEGVPWIEVSVSHTQQALTQLPPPHPGIPIMMLQIKLLYNQQFKVSRPLIFLPFTQLPLCPDNQGSSVINNI